MSTDTHRHMYISAQHDRIQGSTHIHTLSTVCWWFGPNWGSPNTAPTWHFCMALCKEPKINMDAEQAQLP